MKIDIQELIEERKSYPISGLKNSETEYITSKLNTDSGKVGLVVPVMLLHSIKEVNSRQRIFNDWYINGIFDLAEIWKPATNVKFILLVIQKGKPQHVYFSKYLSKETFTGKLDYRKSGIIGEQQITKSYKDYISSLENTINNDTINQATDESRSIWKLNYSEIDLDNLQISFYEPDSRQALMKLKQEKTKALKELAEILRPRKLEGSKGHVIKTKDFVYPLSIKDLSEEQQTTIRLQKGDILFSDSFSGNKKFYLVTDDFKESIFSSTFLVVIRPKSEEITPEYLFLYLQSETVMKYIQLFQRGTFFPHIRSKDLLELPVILPDKITQQKSESVFKTLFLKDKVDVIQAINKELFDDATPDKPIQREFIIEELEVLRMFKKDVIEKVIQGDLKELNTCIDKKLYKSFLILSGSVLEAFLLDWMSEVEKKDYFSPDTEDFTLGKLLWKLKKVHTQIFDEDLIRRADKIREKRNFVHPKEYFNTTEKLNDDMCYEVIDDLKVIINKRMQ